MTVRVGLVLLLAILLAPGSPLGPIATINLLKLTRGICLREGLQGEGPIVKEVQQCAEAGFSTNSGFSTNLGFNTNEVGFNARCWCRRTAALLLLIFDGASRAS